MIVLTRDWHPTNHVSFAENNPGNELYSVVHVPDTGIYQVMWPTHCVAGTEGANFNMQLDVVDSDVIVNKGMHPRVDSYSGFGSRPEITPLESILRQEKVQRVYCVGLAYDYCVGATAIDAANLGFETYLLKDATRSVSPQTEQEMSAKLNNAGVKVITSDQINNKLSKAHSRNFERKVMDEDEKCLYMGEGASIGADDSTYDPYDHLPQSITHLETEGAQFNPCGW